MTESASRAPASGTTGASSRASARGAAPPRTVVVGAGMGGLAAAFSLAARGLPVTLVERHATPGGRMRHVTVAGRAFDAGPTVFTMRWVFETLFARAGLALEEHLPLRRAELLARHSWVGSEPLDLFSDVERSAAAIAALSGPKDADAYRRFAAKSEAMFDTLDATFMRAPRPNPMTLGLRAGASGLPGLLRTEPFSTLWGSLSRSFDDPRLRQLFARYATYCGSSPFRAPATLMLIAHVERAGVWLVEGGMQTLARTLAERVAALGVDCRYGSGVAEIETTGASGGDVRRRLRGTGDGRERVSGVVLENGERIAADAVVFNGDTAALTAGLLGEPLTRATRPRTEPSLSAVTRCQVARPSGFELAHHTVFFGADYPDEFDAIFRRRETTADPTVYVCAQDRSGGTDAATARDEPERLFALANAPARPHTSEEIAAAAARIDDVLARHGLVTADERGREITSPDDFARLFPATDGALYGRPTHGWAGSFSRPGSRSGVRGLYLAGGSVHPGAGVPMTTLSGQLAADALLADHGLERRGA